MLMLNKPIVHFELLSENGQRINSRSFLGTSHLVLFFYPKDSTPV
ncbi:MAG: hypothetical protein ACON4U_21165 [Myxococcota bacterium]